MKNFLVCLLLITTCGEIRGQEDLQVEIILHDVKPGETVKFISKKYLVSPSDIYQLNRFAVDGISPGMVLHIPASRKTETPKKATAAVEQHPESDHGVVVADEDLEKVMDAVEKESARTITPITQHFTDNDPKTTVSHKVLPGETLSALSRKYGVAVADIRELNAAQLEDGLKAGQVILIPFGGTAVIEEAAVSIPPADKSDEAIEHTVEPKETLYSISKKYNVPVDEIKMLNERLLAHGLQAGQVIKIKAK